MELFGLKARTNQRWEEFMTVLTPVLRHLERALVYWARRKYKRLRRHQRRATHWLGRIARRQPGLLYLWQIGIRPAAGQ